MCFIFFWLRIINQKYTIIWSKTNPKPSSSKPSLPPRHRNTKCPKSSSISTYFPYINGKNMGDYWNEDIVRTSVANQKLNIEGEHPVPFMGSGTTGRVCYKLGRSFVGYDLK
ncbi:MAG: DNA modification methylase [Arcticibacterium sp.]|jgi:DNA modification methylase